MVRTLRRIFGLAALGGVGYAIWSLCQSKQETPSAPPTWPPIEAPAAAEAPEQQIAPLAAFASDAGPLVWVAAVDGACPASHPVKANDNSGIAHVPGGRFYDRTAAERCYVTAEAAEADGYRRAKA